MRNLLFLSAIVLFATTNVHAQEVTLTFLLSNTPKRPRASSLWLSALPCFFGHVPCFWLAFLPKTLSCSLAI